MANVFRYRYEGAKGKRQKLKVRTDLLVVRTKHGQGLATASLNRNSNAALDPFETIWALPAARVAVLRFRESKTAATRAVNKAKSTLRAEQDTVQFAGRVLVNENAEPVLYTENLFVQFDSAVSLAKMRRLLKRSNLVVKRQLTYARNAWFVGAEEGTGTEIFEIAEALLQEPDVLLCHPELIQQSSHKATAFPQQWHLKKTRIGSSSIDEHANVEAAWALSEGEGATIAVIDDGVDIDHQEFSGAGKIVAPRDVTLGSPNPRPGPGDKHGTACAGVACANGLHGAAGVAPKAKLMPIRLASDLGSQAEADAFVWAADHGADVISCSWGPRDGRWWEPDDPQHDVVVPLPDSTRLAIDYAVNQGRNGKGCVITWAAGNGFESVSNDGYASYAPVVAVGACNDTGRQAAYSDFGAELWCCFPSSNGEPSRTPGIWTTDNSGLFGYNPGDLDDGDADGHYTNSFGGTSSACPGAAGVCALILARNPDLIAAQVKNILRDSAEKIDQAGGAYADGHSHAYGYGRLNALHAVELAAPVVAHRRTLTYRVAENAAIADNATASSTLAVCSDAPVRDLAVTVDITHTWIGDLVIRLVPPAAVAVAPVVLHNLAGRDQQNIRRTYTVADIPRLAEFIGLSARGDWTLEVSDTQNQDEGQLASFAIELAV